MSKLVNLLRIFVSSPGDLAFEKEIIEAVIDELNSSSYPKSDLRLELVKWETHGYPEIGEDDAQHKINKQIGDDYDIFIGLMWARFGTPTNRAKSGSEEEFNRAYDRYLRDPQGLRILYYFKDAPIPPSQIDPQQLSKVNEFRAHLQTVGLIWTFDAPEMFRQQIRGHLTRHLEEFGKSWGLNEERITTTTSETKLSEVLSGEGIKVLSSKKTFARLSTDEFFNASFVVSYPIVEGIESNEVLQRINSLLSYERVFDVSLKDEIEGGGLSSLDFTVNYLRPPILDITLVMEGVGAYPWQHSHTIVINLDSGRQVFARDLFDESKMEILALQVNELVQLDKSKSHPRLAYECGSEGADVGSGTFGIEDLDHFSLDEGGIRFKHDFQFPHAVKALEPDGDYFFSYDSLKPFVKVNGLLDHE